MNKFGGKSKTFQHLDECMHMYADIFPHTVVFTSCMETVWRPHFTHEEEEYLLNLGTRNSSDGIACVILYMSLVANILYRKKILIIYFIS